MLKLLVCCANSGAGEGGGRGRGDLYQRGARGGGGSIITGLPDAAESHDKVRGETPPCPCHKTNHCCPEILG